jgi:hypothetical protein
MDLKPTTYGKQNEQLDDFGMKSTEKQRQHLPTTRKTA